MGLHRLGADPQGGGDLPVGAAIGDHHHHLVLPGGEFRQAAGDLGALLAIDPALLVSLQGQAQAGDQGLVIEGFLDEVQGAAAHRLHRHAHVAMAGDDHHRDADLLPRQIGLELQAAHARHTHIQ